jgi:hypothetical protein
MCTILTCLYLSIGLAGMRHVPQPPPGYAWMMDITRPQNPYGIIAIGTEFSVRSWISVGAELRHQSSLSTGQDYGQDTASVFVRLTPFRNR